jgi:hypothetical protein
MLVSARPASLPAQGDGRSEDGTPKLEAANVLNSRASLQDMIAGLAKIPLLAQPGTRWSHSIGVDVQGYLVESDRWTRRLGGEGSRSARAMADESVRHCLIPSIPPA